MVKFMVLLRKLLTTDEDERSRQFEMHNFNRSILQFINFFRPLRKIKSVLPSVKYFLKHTTVLVKMVIVARYKGTVKFQDYVKMELEFTGSPRSSTHALCIIFY